MALQGTEQILMIGLAIFTQYPRMMDSHPDMWTDGWW